MAGAIELLESLEDLGDREFKKFKWYLQQAEFLKTIPSIPKYQLESSDREDTVDLMVQTYSRQCVEVARMVLRRMNRNDLAEKLSNAASKASGEVSPAETCSHEVIFGNEEVEVLPKNTLASNGAGNQPTESIEEEPLYSPYPPSPQPSDEAVPAKSGAAEGLMNSSPNNLFSPVSVEVSNDEDNEADTFLYPSDVLSIAKQPEGVKMSALPCPQTTSSPAVLQSNLQNMFISVKDDWLEKHDEETLCYMHPELFITDERGQHEVTGSETETSKSVNVSNMFQHLSRRGKSSRTVVTKGCAGIGKSFLVQEFMLDWAEKRFNQEFHLVFPFDARRLCLWRGERFTLAELIHKVVPGMPSSGVTEETLTAIFTDLQNVRETSCDSSEFKLLFIIDGLDQNLPLEFDFISGTNKSNVRKSSRVEVLLTKLILKKLLPAAYLWITTQSETASQILPECVDMVTELRGFNDLQREEYFRKRFRDEPRASEIISYIKTLKIIHFMCRMPLFCWITAVVLENLWETRERGALPSNLTEMFIEFLVVQINHMKEKYDTRKCIMCIKSLAKLAFKQLLRDNTMSTEEDLRSCGLIMTSERSEGFKEIFKTFSGKTSDNYQKTIFCFTQSSIQKFLAAVHVITSLVSNNKNVMLDSWMTVENCLPCFTRTSTTKLHKTALKRTLKAPNGRLLLFLQFIMGLSLQTNQFLLQDLLAPTRSTSWSNQKIIKYMKKKISESTSPERIIVMFLCLNELRDDSVVEEIRNCLRSQRLSMDKLSPDQWSILILIIMSSEKHLDEFDLNKYSLSEEVLLQLMPVLEASRKALLTGCRLSERSLEALSLVLSSHSSNLKELDLSNSDLQDSGVKLLSVGLQSPNCKLESLRMSNCLIAEAGWDFLASALNTNPSHLRELDLSHNNPGESGMEQLVAGLEDPTWRLQTLRLDHCGEQTLQPDIRKYTCELELDSNTINRNLKLSKSRRKVFSSFHEYPDHLERFDFWPQVLCKHALPSRCYWEVKWKGQVDVAVSYRGISRRGNNSESLFGGNDKSWTLTCFFNQFAVFHSKEKKEIRLSSHVCNRIAVYVDHPAGILSYYVVSFDTLIHLHTFHTTFTEPLYAGFGCDRHKVLDWLTVKSSVSICSPLVDKSVKAAAEER
ncbi:NACHT, LRR and PYD domains-containing protein 3-like isoform X2 [Xiphophorus couchianus]|uniref:NACHT, LRR and PYD domains-containing protein 3-like isoform X2 n=1 Tax=Xiphophorus couchianus TaxID=32473 RepID=UPI001016E6B1|nr:NACHT, LRR and PYD domains-containing protein 3-like isoform X2 [Xiphophorus couchianus]